jgi:uracil-DNA glycosylase
MDAYSKEFRRDVLAACDAGGGTREVALRFGVSESNQGILMSRETNEANLPAWLTATYHPSAILRAPKKIDRERMQFEFIKDLQNAVNCLTSADL